MNETNIYRSAEFLLSANKIVQLPPDQGKEVAFAGRSNAGKSSVINTITNIKSLARTSKIPGRTQLINFFTLVGNRRLADLPGYGFAKVPVKVRQQWGKTLRMYFETRQSLHGLILIVDIRRELSEEDEQMLEWCRVNYLPVRILLNKADKLSYSAAKQTLLRVRQRIGEQNVGVQIFSALKKTGMDELQNQLDGWFLIEK